MDWSLCRDQRRPADVRPHGHRLAHAPPGVPAPPVLRRGSPIRTGESGARHRLAHPGRPEMTPRGLGLGLQVRRRCSSTARRSRARPARRARRRRLVPAVLQRARRGAGLRHPGQRSTAQEWTRSSTPPTPPVPTTLVVKAGGTVSCWTAVGAGPAEDGLTCRTPVRPTYRLQTARLEAWSGLHLRRRRELCWTTSPTWASPTSTCRRS